MIELFRGVGYSCSNTFYCGENIFWTDTLKTMQQLELIRRIFFLKNTFL